MGPSGLGSVMTDNYGPGIVVPTANNPISASQYGVPMRLAVIDLDARMQVLEGEQTLSYQSFTSNSASVGAETAIATTPTLLFPNGYAFEADFGWGVQGNTAGAKADFFVHETNVAGITLGGSGSIVLAATGINYQASLRCQFVNTTGTDLNKAICLTLAASAGTAAWPGSALRPAWFRVKLIDLASNYSGAVSLV